MEKPMNEISLKESLMLLEKQFDNGMLDAAGISLLLAALHEKSIFVFGSSFDFFIFLSSLSSFSEFRFQFIIRDYQPHWVAGDLHILRIARNCTYQGFIFDTIPSNPKKWSSLVSTALKGKGILYCNSETLQSDDFSCKIFCISCARRLAKRSVYEIYGYFNRLKCISSDESIFILPEHSLPDYCMRDTQSMKRLEKYLQLNPSDQLQKYLKTHTQNAGKVMNVSIKIKLRKYREIIQNYLKGNPFVIHEEIQERLGFSNIEENMKKKYTEEKYIVQEEYESLRAPFHILSPLVRLQRERYEIPGPWTIYRGELISTFNERDFYLPEPSSLDERQRGELLFSLRRNTLKYIADGMTSPLYFLSQLLFISER
jgi:hypothetical protein